MIDIALSRNQSLEWESEQSASVIDDNNASEINDDGRVAEQEISGMHFLSNIFEM